MINQDYYIAQNTFSVYLGGKIAHYMRRPPAVVLSSYPYIMTEEDNMYSVALNVFGSSQMNLWTIIADTNQLKQPDEWLPGDIVNLPEIVLNTSLQKATPNYESAPSFTTVL